MRCADCDEPVDASGLGLAADLAVGITLCARCRAEKRKRKRGRFKSGTRACVECGDEYLATRPNMRYCETHRATHGNTTERGYGAAHRRERAKWKPIVEAGEAECAELICVMPSRWIDPVEHSDWELAHTEDRTGYLGPAHHLCNRKERSFRAPDVSSRLISARDSGEFDATRRDGARRFLKRDSRRDSHSEEIAMKNGLLIWTSALVGLQVLSAGSGLTELVGAKVALAVCLGVAAAQAATTNYTRGVVVDAAEADQAVVEAERAGDQRVERVEAGIVTRVDSDGNVRAGEAADVPTGDVVPVVSDPTTGQPVPIAPVQEQLVG